MNDLSDVKIKTAFEEIVEKMALDIAQRKKALDWMLDHKHRFDVLPFGVSYYDGRLDFDNLTHEQVLLVIKAFPAGSWTKTPEEDRVNYEGEFDGMALRCWHGEPPPNCKIVEEQVTVPATTRTVRKLVCKEAFQV